MLRAPQVLADVLDLLRPRLQHHQEGSAEDGGGRVRVPVNAPHLLRMEAACDAARAGRSARTKAVRRGIRRTLRIAPTDRLESRDFGHGPAEPRRAPTLLDSFVAPRTRFGAFARGPIGGRGRSNGRERVAGFRRL